MTLTCIPNLKKIHIGLLPSTYVNSLSPVKYYYKNNRQRVVKVCEFFFKFGMEAKNINRRAPAKFELNLKSGLGDTSLFM